MGFSNNVRNFLEKLQGLPENHKKIIFFAILTVVVLVMGFFEVMLTKKNIASISQSLKSFNPPTIDFSDAENHPIVNMSNLESIGDALENVSNNNTEVFQNK